MTPKIVYTHTVPNKRYHVPPLHDGRYKVKGFIRMNTIWRPMMDTTLTEGQFCRIAMRAPMPKKCNPSCVL